MTALSELELDVDLTSQPHRYPGPAAPWSGVLVDEHYLQLGHVSGRRLGQHRILDDHGLAALGISGRCNLNHLALRRNAASVDQRYPVLCIGSNASPAQLLRKFRADATSAFTPMVEVRVRGIAVGYSAHLSAPGYVPAAAFPSEREVGLYAIWLDAEQLRTLDETEPNYRRVAVARAEVSVTLPSTECLEWCYVYLSRWGVLTDDRQAPIPLGTQEDIIRELRTACPPLAALPGRPPEVREREATALFAELERSLAVDLGSPEIPPETVRYGAQLSMLELADSEEQIAQPTADTVDRRGEPSVCLPTRYRLANAAPTHVMVSTSRTSAPPVVARVADGACRTERCAHLDQVTRNALGVEVGEPVELTPVQGRRSRIGDILAGSHYALCRVQAADLSTVEKDACLLDPLVLELLGVESGDVLVLEGLPAEANGRVPELRIRAFRAPEAVVARRQRLHGGGFDTRFPSAKDALGVYPDLPWLFLDSKSRAKLELGDTKLAAVRVRASRRHQVQKELREALLLAALAVIGIIAVIDRPAVQAGALLVFLVFVLLVVVVRLRARLTQR